MRKNRCGLAGPQHFVTRRVSEGGIRRRGKLSDVVRRSLILMLRVLSPLSPGTSARSTDDSKNTYFADVLGERAGVRGLLLVVLFPLTPTLSPTNASHVESS